jgi:hypothetical protein
LLRPTSVERAVEAVRAAYAERGFREPGWFAVDRPAGGAHRIG